MVSTRFPSNTSTYLLQNTSIVDSLYAAYNRSHDLSPKLCDLLHRAIGMQLGRLTIADMRGHDWLRTTEQATDDEVDLDRTPVWKTVFGSFSSCALPSLMRAIPLLP